MDKEKIHKRIKIKKKKDIDIMKRKNEEKEGKEER